MLTNWRMWAIMSLLLTAGWTMTIRANRALMVAYAHPQVKTIFVQARHEQKDVAVKTVWVVKYLPGGTTEMTKTEDFVDRSHTDIQTDSSTVSTPILSPFQAPKRLLWAGWSIPERSPMVGASARFLGPLWLGGWVRPGTVWDFGPALMVSF